MWQIGSKLCIDEGRVRSKSRRNPFKVRNPDKPIRMGWTGARLVIKDSMVATLFVIML